MSLFGLVFCATLALIRQSDWRLRLVVFSLFICHACEFQKRPSINSQFDLNSNFFLHAAFLSGIFFFFFEEFRYLIAVLFVLMAQIDWTLLMDFWIFAWIRVTEPKTYATHYTIRLVSVAYFVFKWISFQSSWI